MTYRRKKLVVDRAIKKGVFWFGEKACDSSRFIVFHFALGLSGLSSRCDVVFSWLRVGAGSGRVG